MATYTDDEEDLDLEDEKKRQPEDEESIGSPITAAKPSGGIGGAIAPSGIAPLPRQPEETTSTPLSSTLEPPKSVAAPEPLAIGSMIAQPAPPSAARPAADRLAQLETRGPAVSQKHGLGGGLLKTADAIGNIIAPNATQWIPGTTSNYYNRELPAAQRAVTDENAVITNEEAEKDNASKRDLEAAQANRLNNPIAKQENVQQGYSNAIQDAIRNGRDPSTDPHVQAWANAITAVQKDTPAKPAGTKDVERIVGGKTHTIMVNGETGEDIKDLGEKKEPPPPPGEKLSAAEKVTVEKESRNAIRKAEQKYRETQKSVGQLNQAIDSASDGNGLMTSFVPTMEVLGMNVSQGIHRISPAEAEAANLPGGWAERFNAYFDKATQNKLTPQLRDEGKQLASVLAKASRKQYEDTYDDEAGTVEGYGIQGFKNRVKKAEASSGETAAAPSEFKVPAGAPAAPQEDGHKLKQNGQVIAISQGGKWVAAPAPPSK